MRDTDLRVTSLVMGRHRGGARAAAASRVRGASEAGPTLPAESRPHGGSAVRARFRHGRLVDLRYAAVSTAKQDLDRQVDALHQVGIPPERVLPGQEVRRHDRPARTRSGAGLRWGRRRDRRAHLGPARPHGPRHPQPRRRAGERGVGVRNLADPIRVGSANLGDLLISAGSEGAVSKACCPRTPPPGSVEPSGDDGDNIAREAPGIGSARRPMVMARGGARRTPGTRAPGH